MFIFCINVNGVATLLIADSREEVVKLYPGAEIVQIWRRIPTS